MGTNRLETFADGVLAIAATLLILDVGKRVAATHQATLGGRLAHAWPAYVAYAVSFFTIGVIWSNHHTVLTQIARVDRTFLLLNVGLLMCVAFIPFPTSLIAEHILSEGARPSALAYGITLTVTALMFNAVWHYASFRGRLLGSDADPGAVSGITRSYAIGPAVYLAATLVAIASAKAAALVFVAITVFYVIESSLFGRGSSAASSSS